MALGLYGRVLLVGFFGMPGAGSTPRWPMPSSGRDPWDEGSRLDSVDSEGAPQWGPLVWDRDRRPFEKLKEAEGALSTWVGSNAVFRGFVNPQKYLRRLLVLNFCSKQMPAAHCNKNNSSNLFFICSKSAY